jgi:hypothetical protein
MISLCQAQLGSNFQRLEEGLVTENNSTTSFFDMSFATSQFLMMTGFDDHPKIAKLPQQQQQQQQQAGAHTRLLLSYIVVVV